MRLFPEYFAEVKAMLHFSHLPVILRQLPPLHLQAKAVRPEYSPAVLESKTSFAFFGPDVDRICEFIKMQVCSSHGYG
jgi:hypothetical protein